MREATYEEKIWMAGFSDGEGCFMVSFLKPRQGRITGRHYCVAEINNTNTDSLELFSEIYGGTILKKHRNDPTKHKQGFAWRCPDSSLPRFLSDVLPYLRIKRKQADLLVRFNALGKSGNGVKPSTELWESRHELYEQSKNLNARGPKDIRLELVS